MWGEDEKEDVSCCSITLRKREGTRALWRYHFGISYRPVVRYITERMNEWILVKERETLRKSSVRTDDILDGDGSGHLPDTCLKLHSLGQLVRHYKVHIPTSAQIAVTQYLPSIPRIWWNRPRLLFFLRSPNGWAPHKLTCKISAARL